jgi:tetratricopeptide (TPR) repeat protein
MDEAGELLGQRIAEVRRLIPQPALADNAHASWILNILLDDLGFNLMSRELMGEAEAALREAIALGEARGDHWAAAFSHLKLGYIYLGRGELAEAVGSFARAMQVAEEYGDRRLAIFANSGLTESIMQTGPLPEAARWAEQSASLSREIGMRLTLAEALEMLGDILHQRGFPAEAVHH